MFIYDESVFGRTYWAYPGLLFLLPNNTILYIE